MARPAQPIEIRFKRFVEKTRRGCWVWTGGLCDDGAGKFQVPSIFAPNGKSSTMRAPRVAWFIAHGAWPSALVLHRCDEPRCVNPLHLFLGSHTANMADMVTKQRSAGARGTWNGGPRSPENSRTATLTWPKVRSIRRLFKTGAWTKGALSRRYAVSWTTIWQILTNRTWVESRW